MDFLLGAAPTKGVHCSDQTVGIVGGNCDPQVDITRVPFVPVMSDGPPADDEVL